MMLRIAFRMGWDDVRRIHLICCTFCSSEEVTGLKVQLHIDGEREWHHICERCAKQLVEKGVAKELAEKDQEVLLCSEQTRNRICRLPRKPLQQNLFKEWDR